MAIEDAAALGILFNKTYFRGDIAESLVVYDAVRLPRATRVQAAAAKAAYNINERIGGFFVFFVFPCPRPQPLDFTRRLLFLTCHLPSVSYIQFHLY
jgi:2-polyprenyl-6-methoxyphenol hydroxylase-like FAD-dependent oxidoreductase